MIKGPHRFAEHTAAAGNTSADILRVATSDRRESWEADIQHSKFHSPLDTFRKHLRLQKSHRLVIVEVEHKLEDI